MFNERLKYLRKKDRYTINDLVELYNNRFSGNLTANELSAYESGSAIPVYTIVLNLSNLLNVSVDYLTCNNNSEDIVFNADKNIIVYNKNGKIIKKKISEEQMYMLTSMVNAIPECRK